MKQKDKKIIKNFFYNVAYQFLLVVIPLITTPYLSRVIGAEGIGKYSYTYTIVSYFIMFCILGTGVYGERKIAANQEDKVQRSVIFWEIFTLRVVTTLLGGSIYWYAFCRESDNLIYRIQALHIVVVAIDITWLFAGLEDFPKIVKRNVFIKILNIFFILACVRETSDTWKYCFGQAATLLLGYAFMWPPALKNDIVRVPIVKLHPFKRVAEIIPFWLSTVMEQIYPLIDKTMIGYFWMDYQISGYYEQAQRIALLCLLVVTALVNVMSPRIVSIYVKKENELIQKYMYATYRFVILAAMPLASGLAIISPIFVPWFLGTEYGGVIPLIQILSMIIFIQGINMVTGTQYMLATGYQKEYFISVFIGTIANIILNNLFIPDYAAIGAARASVASQVIIMIMMFFFVRKVIKWKKIIWISLEYVISTILMIIGIYSFMDHCTSSISDLIFLVLTGVFIYVLSELFINFICKKLIESIVRSKK